MQQQLEDIEIQLWEYLDGSCSEADKRRTEQLISSNEVWRGKFAELKALQSQLQDLEVHHPSMRFSANVMDSIASTHVISATTHYINNWVVKGIAAFFMVLIGAAIVLSIIAVNTPSENYTSNFNIQKYVSSDVLKAVMFINIVLLLVLVDKFVSKAGEHTLR